MMEQTTTQSPQSPYAAPAANRPQQPGVSEQPEPSYQPSLTQSADQALQSVGALYTAVDGVLQRQVQDNPYLTLAAAAGVGFVLGGGLRTSFGQLLVRMSVRAFGPPLLNATLHGVLERAGVALPEQR
jgi:hypothetical protein